MIMEQDKGKVIELFKESEKKKSKALEPKELPSEVSEFIEFTTKEGFKELEIVLETFKTAADTLDNLVIGELFEAPMEMVRHAYDKLYEIFEDDIDPEGLHGKEKAHYIDGQKVRSHLLVKLYDRYKEDKNESLNED
jgi:hypothetical protein